MGYKVSMEILELLPLQKYLNDIPLVIVLLVLYFFKESKRFATKVFVFKEMKKLEDKLREEMREEIKGKS